MGKEESLQGNWELGNGNERSNGVDVQKENKIEIGTIKRVGGENFHLEGMGKCPRAEVERRQPVLGPVERTEPSLQVVMHRCRDHDGVERRVDLGSERRG